MKRSVRSSAAVVFIIAVFAGVFAALFFSKFEFYRRQGRSRPSAEAERNRYLAVERWLRGEGHPVRVLSSGGAGSLARGAERTALVFSSSFDWEEAGELDALLDEGYAMTLFIDDWGDENARAFLERQGLSYRIREDAEEDAEEKEAEAAGEEETHFPDFDRAFFAGIAEKEAAGAVHLSDAEGETRLTGWQTAKSALFLTGIPYFMDWELLQNGADGALHAENARLSWRLSGALDPDKKGVLIICGAAAAAGRGRVERTPGFWERFFEHRLGAAVAAAAILAAAAGIWMTFPSFGRWKPERIFPGAPIRQRFVTESRFFKKEKALFVYLEPYADALRARYRAAGVEDDAEIRRRLAADTALDEESAARLLSPRAFPITNGFELEKYRALACRALERLQ